MEERYFFLQEMLHLTNVGARVAMWGIVCFFRKKDYIRCPIEVPYFLKVGEPLFSNKCLSLPCEKKLLV